MTWGYNAQSAWLKETQTQQYTSANGPKHCHAGYLTMHGRALSLGVYWHGLSLRRTLILTAYQQVQQRRHTASAENRKHPRPGRKARAALHLL